MRLLPLFLFVLGAGSLAAIQHSGSVRAADQFLPGAAILALALAFNLVGDALRDILDPTQRGRE